MNGNESRAIHFRTEMNGVLRFFVFFRILFFLCLFLCLSVFFFVFFLIFGQKCEKKNNDLLFKSFKTKQRCQKKNNGFRFFPGVRCRLCLCFDPSLPSPQRTTNDFFSAKHNFQELMLMVGCYIFSSPRKCAPFILNFKMRMSHIHCSATAASFSPPLRLLHLFHPPRNLVVFFILLPWIHSGLINYPCSSSHPRLRHCHSHLLPPLPLLSLLPSLFVILIMLLSNCFIN